MNKSELRKIMCAKRRAIDPATRQKAAEQAAEIFANSSIFQTSQHIACYSALPEEFDCHPIIEKIWQAKKNCYLPILTENNLLRFANYDPNDVLQLNRYKILEPNHTDFFPVEKLDIVILPLVAWDSKGNRLGMGAGYYDRTFSQLIKNPHLIGLGYAIQNINHLNQDEWDIPLQKMLTENQLIEF